MKAYGDVVFRKLQPYDRAEDLRLAQEHNVGALSTQEYQVVERVRMRKSIGFLRLDKVADKLLACTLALRPTVTLLGKHFKASKLDASGMNLLD